MKKWSVCEQQSWSGSRWYGAHLIWTSMLLWWNWFPVCFDPVSSRGKQSLLCILLPRYGVKNRMLQIPLSELVYTQRLTNSKTFGFCSMALELLIHGDAKSRKTQCNMSGTGKVPVQFSFFTTRTQEIIIIISAAKANMCWLEDHETSEMVFFLNF